MTIGGRKGLLLANATIVQVRVVQEGEADCEKMTSLSQKGILVRITDGKDGIIQWALHK